MGEIYCLYSTGEGIPRYVGQTEGSSRHSIPIRVTITMRCIDATLAVVGALLFSSGAAWASYHQLCREKNYGEYG